jgi:flagellar protein FlaI
MQKIIESYEIEADAFKVQVNINGGGGMPKSYEIVIPEPKKATKALLNEVRRSLVAEVSVTASEILDVKGMGVLKERFKKKAELLLDKILPSVNDTTKKFLIGTLLHDMVGFGSIEFLLNDGELEEIIILSAKEPIRVFHKKHGWLMTNITVDSEAQIQNYANMIARRVGRQINTLSPLLDAHLVSGDRANAVYYPISSKGNTITIRKFARDPWTVTDFINNGTSTPEVFALIWLLMQYEMNILISGGTGSGKTSFLNLCAPFIPPTQRIISIEDTRELQLPKFLYWCPMTTRIANVEGKGEVTMLHLLVNSLRMRPDRIILGEMRRKEEAEVLFEAMHTGHSVYATVHADSILETVSRLINPPLNVPPNLLPAVNLNVVMFRDRRTGIRRTYQVGEFIVTEKGNQSCVDANILYRWKPTNDKIAKHNASVRLFEDLSRHTGMSMPEIDKELETRRKILVYMTKHNIRSIGQVGRLMNEFYLEPDFITKNVLRNATPNVLMREQS